MSAESEDIQQLWFLLCELCQRQDRPNHEGKPTINPRYQICYVPLQPHNIPAPPHPCTSGNEWRCTSSDKTPWLRSSCFSPAYAHKRSDMLAREAPGRASKAEVWLECSRHWERKGNLISPDQGWRAGRGPLCGCLLQICEEQKWGGPSN